ncbi:MAG: response regulator [Planctomycetes bacterium]|nr:response regulator [Planctomycetota bacterium]
MNLRDVTGGMLREAVAIYLEEAYGGAKPRRRVPDLSQAASASDALPLMEDESRRHADGQRARRWVLRLGNSRYPNMKLALEEYLLAGEFVFTVDTHDEAVVLPGDPDAAAWGEIRRWNLALKRRIEERWRRSGLPTYAALKEILARAAVARPPGPPRGTVLVVDDEPDIADTVEAILAADGWAVRKAGDGPEALEALRRGRPDLVLMDYEMPRMKGTEVCARIRRSRTDRDIPILLATAAMVDLAAIADADGFLVKPYQRGVLLSFVGHLAGRRKGAAAGAPAAPPRRPGRAAIRRRGRGGPVGSVPSSTDTDEE